MELVLVESIIKLQEREKWEMKQEKWLKAEQWELPYLPYIYSWNIFNQYVGLVA